MRRLEGTNIWVRPGSDGKNRYYYRCLQGIFDNGKRKYRDIRRSLGTDLGLAHRKARILDSESATLKVHGEPRKDLKLKDCIAWYISHIRDTRRLLGWKKVKSSLMAFLEFMGDVPVACITKAEIDRFLTRRKQVVRNTTANIALRDCKRLFSAAVEQGFLDENPAAKVKGLRSSPLPVRIPTPEELNKLLVYLESQKPWLYRIILVLLGTGARLGEALALTWAKVDFTRGTLELPRQKVQDELVVPMAGVLKEILWVYWTTNGMPKEGHVFLSKIGKPYTSTRVLNAFKPVARKLGMGWLTLKHFRKTAATYATESTGDIRVAQMLLGHSSSRTTELYLGKGAEARARGVQAMDKLLGRIVGTANWHREAESIRVRGQG